MLEEETPTRRTRRDWIVDSALFLATAVASAAALAEQIDRGLDGPLLILDVIAGAGLLLALWGRRRWPLGVALAGVPIAAFSSFGFFPAMVALYTVAARRRWQLVGLVFALQLAVLPIYRTVQIGDTVPNALHYAVCFFAYTAIVASGMFMRARRQTLRERARRAAAEQQLLLEQARYAERTRIAREMHDVLAHRISLLSLHAGALEFRPGAPAEEIARAAAVIRASAHQALEDLRAVIGVLRDQHDGESPQPPQPTLASLPALLEESRAAGMRLHAEVLLDDPSSVPDAVGRHALRIVQEALTNARKHATAAPVELRVEGAQGEGLTIEVRNPAPVLAGGGSVIPGAGAGLVGLAERATLSGGSLEHGLDEDGEFRVHAWLPWPA
ncbi:histidine kinase [Solirubrobacter ginsenosidimutans]|uniref:histidine kinase n=1 Tax=Solirubrobacter ginsenosidimutans TaxID=490573 RepID=A0A9X3RZD0_9ACTN|nr:histidine kinase [Solirubrobacter ginsenosidimutans]MDA0160019.1 histidine kinase [Solirubrobacter ginsenosidimutans]